MYKKAKNVRFFGYGYGMLRPRKIDKLCEIYEVLGWFLVAIQFLVLEIFELFAFENCQVLETPERYLIIMEKVEGTVGNGARVVAVQ